MSLHTCSAEVDTSDRTIKFRKEVLHLQLPSLPRLSPAVCLQDTMPVEDKMALRMTAIDQVLGTDMKKHFSILSRFQVNCIPCWAPLVMTALCWWAVLSYHSWIGTTYSGYQTPQKLMLSIAFTRWLFQLQHCTAIQHCRHPDTSILEVEACSALTTCIKCVLSIVTGSPVEVTEALQMLCCYSVS